MRWERLFADLELELEAAETAELESEIADRTRSVRARLLLVDRLRGSIGGDVTLRVLGAGQVTGAMRAVGADWCLVRPEDGADRLVPTSAVLEVVGLAASSTDRATIGEVAALFSLAAVLRQLARDRTVVTVTLLDGSTRTGTIEIAGADVVELSDRRHDEPGYAAPSARTRWTIPSAALAMLREH